MCGGGAERVGVSLDLVCDHAAFDIVSSCWRSVPPQPPPPDHMPHAGDDLASADEVKVYKDEGDEEEQRSSENLSEDKIGLVTETEQVGLLLICRALLDICTVCACYLIHWHGAVKELALLEGSQKCNRVGPGVIQDLARLFSQGVWSSRHAVSSSQL